MFRPDKSGQHMDISPSDERRAFSTWMRTGRLPAAPEDRVELKFNPYYDPRNGRFTFAPGGPGYSSPSPRWRSPKKRLLPASPASLQNAVLDRPLPAVEPRSADLADTVYRPDTMRPAFLRTAGSRFPDLRSNSRAFQDPMTLEQAFPGLRNAPGGAIVAVADSLLDFSGPGRQTTTALSQEYAKVLIEQTRALQPSYRHDSFGFPETFDGQMRLLEDLRFERATAFFRHGELSPMQIETYRFMQARADEAYAEGLKLIKSGKLKIHISIELTLGNHVDRRTRNASKARYTESGIDASGPGPVRVNRREYNSDEGSYRRPDARVGEVAYDVTLSEKTEKTAQVRGFFDADFKPSYVVIIRPTQLGKGGSYIIKRPENKR